MKVHRVERHIIKKSNPMWKTIDGYCFRAKNVYNIGNYIVRQEFLKSGQWIRYYPLDKIMHAYPEYYELGSQASQNILTLLDSNWNSFFKGIKQWSKVNGSGFLGKPNLPKYKDKNGRCQLILKNIQCRITPEQTIYFSWKPLNKFSGIKTKIFGKLMRIRFVPQGNCYVMEVIYETEVLKLQPVSSIIAIDLGINNFATISNNIGIQPIIINGKTIKSMNQYYNKKRAEVQSETKMVWNNRLQNLTDKHRRKMDCYMHKSSRVIIDYRLEYGISTIVIGKNDGWKQEMNIGKRNNQNFSYIPYEKFISKLRYKAENVGINFIESEESYTSGTSFLDNESPIKENYNKARRLKRGLFRSNSGRTINADLNGSYQIMKKVFPNVNVQWNTGCDLHPVRVNI